MVEPQLFELQFFEFQLFEISGTFHEKIDYL